MIKCWQFFKNLGFEIPKQEYSYYENTSCLKIEGRNISKNLRDQIASYVQEKGFVCRLAVVLASEDPASNVYVNTVEKSFIKMNLECEIHRLKNPTEEDLKNLILKLAEDHHVHGILLQLPLPHNINEQNIIPCIPFEKDVDGISSVNMGFLSLGLWDKGLLPCTPFASMVLMEAYDFSWKGKNVAVIGRSNIVGKPMSLLALGEDATVTIMHSKTKNLERICRENHVVIAALGKKEFLKSYMLSSSSMVIDIGIHEDGDSLCGDVQKDIYKYISGYTPVPGGVGPLTITMLAYQTLKAFLWQKKEVGSGK